MRKTAESNRKKIFDNGHTMGHMARRCTITGRCKKPIAGIVRVYPYNLTDLWVWTDQKSRQNQEVHARINLQSKAALAELEAAGVTLT